MHDAFKVWDIRGESLESVEARIHDGVPAERLHDRAAGMAERVRRIPTWLTLDPQKTVVEVGPGVGYIMQAMVNQTGLARITGLDVAPTMNEQARARVARDGLSAECFRFTTYDGVNFPWKDGEVDLFYSVAAIQHIPKPFAYNVLLEMNRCLRPGGTAVVQLLTWDILARDPSYFAQEIRNQIQGKTVHWHHFYERAELEALARWALSAADYRIYVEDVSIWLAWKKRQA